MELKKQDFKVFEPDWNSINTISDIKLLMVQLTNPMIYDLSNEVESKIVELLLEKKIIKQVNVQLINNNKTNNNLN